MGHMFYLFSKFKIVHLYRFLFMGRQLKQPLLNGEGDVNLAFCQG